MSEKLNNKIKGIVGSEIQNTDHTEQQITESIARKLAQFIEKREQNLVLVSAISGGLITGGILTMLGYAETKKPLEKIKQLEAENNYLKNGAMVLKSAAKPAKDNKTFDQFMDEFRKTKTASIKPQTITQNKTR